MRCLGTPDWSALLDEALANVMPMKKLRRSRVCATVANYAFLQRLNPSPASETPKSTIVEGSGTAVTSPSRIAHPDKLIPPAWVVIAPPLKLKVQGADAFGHTVLVQ